MVVKVTLRDIIEGGVTPHGNPIALAIQRQTNDSHIRVEHQDFNEKGQTVYVPSVVFPRTTCDHRIPLPLQAIEWLNAFERELKVEPFEFEIPYTYRTAGEEFLHRQAMKKLQKSKLFP